MKRDSLRVYRKKNFGNHGDYEQVRRAIGPEWADMVLETAYQQEQFERAQRETRQK